MGKSSPDLPYGGFLKRWYPTTMGKLLLKWSSLGVFWGYHHLRKHPYVASPCVPSFPWVHLFLALGSIRGIRRCFPLHCQGAKRALKGGREMPCLFWCFCGVKQLNIWKHMKNGVFGFKWHLKIQSCSKNWWLIIDGIVWWLMMLLIFEDVCWLVFDDVSWLMFDDDHTCSHHLYLLVSLQLVWFAWVIEKIGSISRPQNVPCINITKSLLKRPWTKKPFFRVCRPYCGHVSMDKIHQNRSRWADDSPWFWHFLCWWFCHWQDFS